MIAPAALADTVPLMPHALLTTKLKLAWWEEESLQGITHSQARTRTLVRIKGHRPSSPSCLLHPTCFNPCFRCFFLVATLVFPRDEVSLFSNWLF